MCDSVKIYPKTVLRWQSSIDLVNENTVSQVGASTTSLVAKFTTKFSKQNHTLKFITTIRGRKNLKEILCNRNWRDEIQFYEQFY